MAICEPRFPVVDVEDDRAVGPEAVEQGDAVALEARFRGDDDLALDGLTDGGDGREEAVEVPRGRDAVVLELVLERFPDARSEFGTD